MSAKVTVAPGSIELEHVSLCRVSADVYFAAIECRSKYPSVSSFGGSEGVGVILYAGEHTLRPSRRKRFTEVRFSLPGQDWYVMAPESARYSVCVWLYQFKLHSQTKVVWSRRKR